MKVILTVGGLAPEDGGPSRSIPALALALARAGVEVELVTCRARPNQHAPLTPPDPPIKTSLLARSCRSHWLVKSNGFGDAVRSAAGSAADSIIHDNGMWLATNHAAAFAAFMMPRPLIISPRGMLTPWALRFRGWKKRMAWRLYQRRDLQSARVLHATSRDEANGFRAAGLKQPVAIIPNGVELPEGTDQPKTSPRTALFLSRIHPKKGLLDLVAAWSRLQPQGWQVVIAGEDADNHQAEIESAARQHKLDFKFVGPVDGEAKWNLYRRSDLFVLPSHSENFGIVVAEALACGVPVITTRGTPWEELVTHRCGWWTEIGPEPLAEALRSALALTDGERREMGARGRQLVATKYSWPVVAAQMLSVYRWVLGQSATPDCVLP